MDGSCNYFASRIKGGSLVLAAGLPTADRLLAVRAARQCLLLQGCPSEESAYTHGGWPRTRPGGSFPLPPDPSGAPHDRRPPPGACCAVVRGGGWDAGGGSWAGPAVCTPVSGGPWDRPSLAGKVKGGGLPWTGGSKVKSTTKTGGFGGSSRGFSG